MQVEESVIYELIDMIKESKESIVQVEVTPDYSQETGIFNGMDMVIKEGKPAPKSGEDVIVESSKDIRFDIIDSSLKNSDGETLSSIFDIDSNYSTLEFYT